MYRNATNPQVHSFMKIVVLLFCLSMSGLVANFVDCFMVRLALKTLPFTLWHPKSPKIHFPSFIYFCLVTMNSRLSPPKGTLESGDWDVV